MSKNCLAFLYLRPTILFMSQMRPTASHMSDMLDLGHFPPLGSSDMHLF